VLLNQTIEFNFTLSWYAVGILLKLRLIKNANGWVKDKCEWGKINLVSKSNFCDVIDGLLNFFKIFVKYF
jgi:hypothetical protein